MIRQILAWVVDALMGKNSRTSLGTGMGAVAPSKVHVQLEPAASTAVSGIKGCIAALSSDGLTVQGTNAEEVAQVSERLAKIINVGAKTEAAVGEHLEKAKGLFYLMVGGVLLASLSFIGAGLALVYLGASGRSQLKILGNVIDAENVGIVSIALGAIVLVLLLRSAMAHIKDILALHRGPNDR